MIVSNQCTLLLYYTQVSVYKPIENVTFINYTYSGLLALRLICARDCEDNLVDLVGTALK